MSLGVAVPIATIMTINSLYRAKAQERALDNFSLSIVLYAIAAIIVTTKSD